ncbi:MAG: NADH-quinone oxidoreductase subunit A [Actinobacteria bacterium]|nr:NADH-quinone oxidoreductase subunit A [Actinomycetota bacterium]
MSTSFYDLINVFVFTLVGTAFVGIVLFVSKLVRCKNPSPEKLAPYECGNKASGEARPQTQIRYYLFALLLVVFDVEMIFLFPWGVAFRSLGLIALVEVALFIGILLLGLAFAWRKGALKWQ